MQDRLDLSAGELAVAVLGVEGGALLGLSLGGLVVGRWGSRRAAQAGFAVYAPGVLAAALSPNLALLAVGLGVWAAANSVLDVALNAQGVELERRAGRPLLSGLHAVQGPACWSVPPSPRRPRPPGCRWSCTSAPSPWWGSRRVCSGPGRCCPGRNRPHRAPARSAGRRAGSC